MIQNVSCVIGASQKLDVEDQHLEHQDWCVHVVPSDIAQNTVKALEVADLPSLPSVALTLQSAVSEGLWAQCNIRTIIIHFTHSLIA